MDVVVGKAISRVRWLMECCVMVVGEVLCRLMAS